MDDFESHRTAASRRSWIVPALLLTAGVLIGVVLTSDLGWLPTGHAVPGTASLLLPLDRLRRRYSPRCPARAGRVSSMLPKW